MTPEAREAIIKENLDEIIDEMARQKEVGKAFPPELLSFDDQMMQLRELVAEAGEYGIAYESIVATLEQRPFFLSGRAAVCLLEVGLLLRFKTQRGEDQRFDFSEDSYVVGR